MIEHKPKTFGEAVCLYLLGYENVRHLFGELVFTSPDARIIVAAGDYYDFKHYVSTDAIWRVENFLKSL